MAELQTSEPTVNTGLTFPMLWRAIVTGKWIIVAAVVAMLLVCLAIALFATPQYVASTVLAPPNAGAEAGGLSSLAGQFGGLADIAGLDLGGRQNVDQTLVILQSDEFLESFIQAEGVPQLLFAQRWDPETRKWRPPDSSLWARLIGSLSDTPHASHESAAPDSWSVLRGFKSIITVDKDKRTQIVTLSIRWKDPNAAAAWANSLVGHINQEAQARAIHEANERLRYLDEQLKQTQVLELRDTLYKLVGSEQKQAMVASTRQELALRVLAKAQVPRERVFPRRKLLLIGGVVCGLVIGVFLALARVLISSNPRR